MERRLLLAVAFTLAATIGSACSSSVGAHHAVLSRQERTTLGPSSMAVQPASSPSPAVQLRSDLEMLLGDHMLLMTELMRERVANAAPRSRATLESVQKNADDITAAIRQVYGPASSARFEELWMFHVKRLFDYAAAVATRNDASEQRARADLRTLEHDLGSFLTAATGGAMSQTVTQQALRMHIDGLLNQTDAFAAGALARAEALELEGFNHMVGLADDLATAIARSKHIPATDLSAPRRILQSALARLLSAHMGLMVEEMRAVVDKAPQVAATGTTLNSNSSSVAKAVAALYGQPAGRRFLDLWAQHVDALITYADAVRRHDDAVEEAQKGTLSKVATELAVFLATATRQKLPAVQLSAALGMHDEDLLSQADAYAAGDFGRSQTVAQQGYRHMFGLAQTLADAIGDAVASRLPHGGVQTGGGGMAGKR